MHANLHKVLLSSKEFLQTLLMTYKSLESFNVGRLCDNNFWNEIPAQLIYLIVQFRMTIEVYNTYK